ncbi:MAG: Dyp-type peroxidase [Beijerinckiaceae bacterium]
MAVELDYADIQGNVLVAYGIQGLYKGRVMLFHIENGKGAAGRKFVTELLPMITTAQACPPGTIADPEKLRVAVNIAFTWYGLLALGIPIRTLRGMPDEFIDGMINRAPMLGDDYHKDWKDKWDEVWTKSGLSFGPNPNTVHILVTLNAQMDDRTGAAVSELETKTAKINELAQTSGGVTLLKGHNQPRQTAQPYQEKPYQDLSLIIKRENGKYVPTPKEHFGFTDGIGDPVFEGQYPEEYEAAKVKGNGALDGKGNWRPLATGEFLLGYPDEAQEIAGAAMPLDFSRNGTFMAYRKLHQNVVAFTSFMDEKVEEFRAVAGIENIDHARETLMAKMVGRWSDGVPLSIAPTFNEWEAFGEKYPDVTYATDPKGWAARNVALANFSYGDDPDGIKCPLTAHMRRVNTRDGLGPSGGDGSVLTNRRRILRRGLLYGNTSDDAPRTDEQGVVMLIVCANLFRQFEFVQQQWINYGLDAGAGSDTCPIVGNHSDGTPGGKHGPAAKFVIPADPVGGHLPFIVEGIPQFVETRGGEYFFVPSMTALRMIGMGVVDPT